MKLKIMGALGITAALLLGLAVPASAETKTFKDPAGDAVLESQAYNPPSLSDITSLRVDYNVKSLQMTLGFAQLYVENGQWTQFHIDTNNDGKGDYIIFSKRNGGSDLVMMFKGSDTITQGGKTPVTFTQQAGRNGSMTFTVPSKHIGKAKSIRLNMRVSQWDPSSWAYLDGYDSLPNAKAGKIQWTPKISIAGKTTDKKPTSATASLSKSRQTVGKKKTAKVTVAVSPKVAGKAIVFDGKTKLGTVTVKKGTASFKLPKTLAVGKHLIKVTFKPSNKKKYSASKSKAGTLTVTAKK